jgi:hypothetical protein
MKTLIIFYCGIVIVLGLLSNTSAVTRPSYSLYSEREGKNLKHKETVSQLRTCVYYAIVPTVPFEL